MFSSRLGYPAWLVFLRYLAVTKHLVLHQVWAALEQVKSGPEHTFNQVLKIQKKKTGIITMEYLGP